ncbi:hypothetical protein RFF05_14430 [Bengtsoniella intestinalis]|uniref:hypothetical protein n=1 Tax=Bengtsoniella intestinalis TaxID=3073143 RepID=UPI00391F6F7A
MKSNNLMNFSFATLALGCLFMIFSVGLPAELLANSMGGARIDGILTLYYCPVLGLVGLGLSAYHKKFMLAFANLIIIFAFPIMWFVVELVNQTP